MRLLVLGYGYSARAVHAALAADLEAIAATTRDSARAASLAAAGIAPVPWDGGDDGPVRAALARATHLLATAAPGPAGDPFLPWLDLSAAPALRWAGYLSTTGVYGDRQGGWVDEDTPPAPPPGRSVLRLAAEEAWRAACSARGVPFCIFRLTGIYGPGRSPFGGLRAGTARAILKPGQVFNRIHADDIGRLVAAAARAGQGGVLNLADDEPAPPQDVLAHAAGLLGLPPPPAVPYGEADLSPMGRSFYEENKRVSNARARALFGPFLHPTYRQGLAATLAAEGTAA